jgi:AcrR family transcriptional regulator
MPVHGVVSDIASTRHQLVIVLNNNTIPSRGLTWLRSFYTADMSVQAKQPKRRNAPKTKAAILSAAQTAFAEHGYAQTGIRDIAALADISSPLLLRYFGSKAGLFEAALIDAVQVEELFDVDRSKFGEHLTSLFMDAKLDIKPPSIIALSTGHADARDIATRVTNEQVIAPLAKWLGPPDARTRALQIVMIAMGFVLCTRQFPLMPARKGIDKKLAKWFAKTVQAVVDQE